LRSAGLLGAKLTSDRGRHLGVLVFGAVLGQKLTLSASTRL